MGKTHEHYEKQRVKNILRAEVRELRLAAKQRGLAERVTKPRGGVIGWCTSSGSFYSADVTLISALPTPLVPSTSDDKARLTRSLVESCKGLRDMGRSPRLP